MRPKSPRKHRKTKIKTFGIAWFRPDDYEVLLSMFTDRDILHSNYEDWLKEAERVIHQLQVDGQSWRKVYIHPDTFPRWCAERGLEVNADARSEFAAEAVAREG